MHFGQCYCLSLGCRVLAADYDDSMTDFAVVVVVVVYYCNKYYCSCLYCLDCHCIGFNNAFKGRQM